jgi:glycosyltransferase 2 family protein
MRRIILWIVVALAIVYVVVSFAEIQSIIDTLKKGNLPFLIVALFFALLCLINNSVTWGAIYRLLGIEETHRHLFLMTTASAFVNMIAPSAGIGGLAVFIDSARKRGQSTARVTVAGILYMLYEYMSLFCVILLGFIVLIRRGDLNAGEMTAAGFLLIVALVDGGILILGYKSKQLLGKVLSALARFGNRLLKRFIHRDFVKEESAINFSNEIADGIATIKGSKKKLMWPFLFTLNNKAILICVLAFTFLAMDTPFSTGTLIGGFSIAHLFYYASPTPGGVGIVEGVFPLALSTLRVPFANALLITLTYRALTFWLPLIVGFVSFRLLQRKHGV